MIDSQLIKTSEGGGPGSNDAGGKIIGRMRDTVTDTLGNPMRRQFTASISNALAAGLTF
jgi:hypothetical protein